MTIKDMARKTLNRIDCKKYNAPSNCIFHRTCQIKNTHFEGKNKVNYGATVLNSSVGFGTYIAQNSIISNTKIGKYSLVGFEALIGGHPIHNIVSVHPAFYSTKGQYGFTYASRDIYQEYTFVDASNKFAIEIGNDVWVTAGSTKIIQGIKIGDGAVVMADAVVTKDVPPYAIVGGIPAKIIGYRFSEEQIDFLLKFKWWDKDEEWLRKHIDDFASIDNLINKVEHERMS